MAELRCIEIPVEYSVAACTRATPFHWALLEVVRTFPVGSRPDFAIIAERSIFTNRPFFPKRGLNWVPNLPLLAPISTPPI
jgi:hypothetical protein